MSIVPPTIASDELVIDEATAALLFTEARTVNHFADAPVPDSRIRAAYDLLRWGPTAMNTQPLRLLQVRTAEGRARLATHMAEGNRARVLAAPLTIVAAIDPDFHEYLDVLAPHATGARARFEEDGIESRAETARMSGLIQVGYLITALRAAGLSTGPMSGFDAAGVDKEFLTETGWRSLLVVNVGVPAAEDASHPRQARLDFDQASMSA